MSLLNDLVQSALGGNKATGQGQDPDLLQSALVLLDRMGGVQGVAEKFQQSGLGDLVASWIGTGQNQPVTGDQVTDALGRDTVEDLSRQANLPAGSGPSILAQVLPALIDQLTPNGQVPEQSQLLNLGKAILSSLATSGSKSPEGGA